MHIKQIVSRVHLFSQISQHTYIVIKQTMTRYHLLYIS